MRFKKVDWSQRVALRVFATFTDRGSCFPGASREGDTGAENRKNGSEDSLAILCTFTQEEADEGAAAAAARGWPGEFVENKKKPPSSDGGSLARRSYLWCLKLTVLTIEVDHLPCLVFLCTARLPFLLILCFNFI